MSTREPMSTRLSGPVASAVLRPRTLLGAASVAAIAAVVLIGTPLGPESARGWVAASGVLAVIAAIQAAASDPRDLKTAMLLALPAVVALAFGEAPAWPMAPLAALLLVAAELNVLGWEAGQAEALSAVQRRRLRSVGIAAAVGAGIGVAVTVAVPGIPAGGPLTLALAAIALAGLGLLLFRPTTVRRPPALCLAVALGLAAPTEARAQQFPPDDDLRLMLRYIVEDGEAPAVALGVLDPDGTTRAVAYGEAGRDGGPVGPGSVFELGELTMPFTATLLMEMVGRGEVALDDPVAMYLPEGMVVPAKGGFDITLEHLAKHTSGLPAEPPAPYDGFTLDDLYAFLARYEPDWVPGRRRELSPLGYGLLGHALARAAGMPFPELLRERVLDPLGMARTGYDGGGELREWRVAGRSDGRVVAYTAPTPALQGGTGLLSSARDMGRFLRANATPPETPLQQAMAATHEVWTPFDPEGEGWGLSWRIRSSPGGMLVTHGGRTSGSTSLIMFSPARGIGTVLLAASADFNDWAARDLLFFRAPPDMGTVRVDPAVLARYVGSYGAPEGRYRSDLDRARLFIRLEDDGMLTYQPRGSVRTPLFPISDSAFYMIRAPLTVSFARVGDAMRMMTVVDGREPRSMGQTWTSWRVTEETPSPVVAADNALPWSAWRAGTWLLVGVVGLAALALILRPVWRRAG